MMRRTVVHPEVERMLSTVVDHVARTDMTNARVERATTAEARNGMPGGMANIGVPDSEPGGTDNTDVPDAVLGGMANTDAPDAVPGGTDNTDVPEGMANIELPDAVPGGMANTEVPDAVPGRMANADVPDIVSAAVPDAVTTVLGDRRATQQTEHGERDHRGHARVCLHSHAHVWPPISTPAGPAAAPQKAPQPQIIAAARRGIFQTTSTFEAAERAVAR